MPIKRQRTGLTLRRVFPADFGILFIHPNRSPNTYRKHKSRVLILGVTYRQNDHYTDIYDGELLRSQRQQNKPKTKITTKQKTKTKQTKKREEGCGVNKQITNRMLS